MFQSSLVLKEEGSELGKWIGPNLAEINAARLANGIEALRVHQPAVAASVAPGQGEKKQVGLSSRCSHSPWRFGGI